jgi:hypothetical protein
MVHFTAVRPEPALVTLPWNVPLEEWDDRLMVNLPRGISRHVVRIVRVGSKVLAVKETRERMALGEYSLLRNLQRLGLPTVSPVAVVTGRGTSSREPLEPCLVTLHLRYSLPYRSLFRHGLPTADLPKIIDALVVLLVRLHLSGFFWGDVSLSNVLFRRSAGEFAAYLVDAETGELHERLSDGQREYDLEIARGNVFGELLDLQAGGFIAEDAFDPFGIVDLLSERYQMLWAELTGTEEFSPDQIWRLDQRIERLNELGFDVEEVDIVTDWDGAAIRVTPRVVEAGHHSRDLQRMTGLAVEENQARRLLNDLSGFAAYHGLGGEDRTFVAHQWLTTVFEPVWEMVPPEMRGKRDPAEVFHEVLEHRWLMAEAAGHEIDTFDAAHDYIESVLRQRPDEAVTTTLTGMEPVRPEPAPASGAGQAARER